MSERASEYRSQGFDSAFAVINFVVHGSLEECAIPMLLVSAFSERFVFRSPLCARENEKGSADLECFTLNCHVKH